MVILHSYLSLLESIIREVAQEEEHFTKATGIIWGSFLTTNLAKPRI